MSVRIMRLEILLFALLAPLAARGGELKTIPPAPSAGGTAFVFPDKSVPDDKVSYKWSVFLDGNDITAAGGPDQPQSAQVESHGPWLKLSEMPAGSYVVVLTSNVPDAEKGKETRWARSFAVEPAPKAPPAEDPMATAVRKAAAHTQRETAAKQEAAVREEAEAAALRVKRDYAAKHPASTHAVRFLAEHRAKQSAEKAAQAAANREPTPQASPGQAAQTTSDSGPEIPLPPALAADALENLAVEAFHRHLTLPQIVAAAKQLAPGELSPEDMERLLREVAIRFDATRTEEHPDRAILALVSLAAAIRTLELPPPPTSPVRKTEERAAPIQPTTVQTRGAVRCCH